MGIDALAGRIVAALSTAHDAVLVRDRCGRSDLVDAVAAECRRRGLEPVVEHVSNDRLRELVGSQSAQVLQRWDDDRAGDSARVTGVISLGGWPFDPTGLPAESVAAWVAAARRVEATLEQRDLPHVVVAVPTVEVATALGMSLESLDAHVLHAIDVGPDTLLAEIEPVVRALGAAAVIELQTPGCALGMTRRQRPLLIDDGVVDADDMRVGATVSNLPGGSVYWTVVEESTRGDVRLTNGSVLRFDADGRVTEGPYAGERISHLGVATNSAVGRTTGWTIVDEHRAGAVFLALGENRYMGGRNSSAINVDLLPSEPTLLADGCVVVERGRLRPT